MSRTSTPTTFDGTTGVSSDVFIRSVRQHSLREGKEKDDDWIALSAASCLEGEALEWYEDQEDDVQENWKLLRRAILVRWPPSRVGAGAAAQAPISPSTPSASASIPTPAAAPPPVGRAPLPARSGQTTRNLKSGSIRVVRKTGERLGYVSADLGDRGDYHVTTNPANAVAVEFEPSLEPHELTVIGPRADRLGVAMVKQGSTLSLAHANCTRGELWWFTLSDVQYSPSSFRSGWKSRWGHKQGEGRAAVWNVLIDGKCRLLWETTNRALYPMDFAVVESGPNPSSNGLIQCSTNFAILSDPTNPTFSATTYIPVDLVFEESQY